MDQKFGDRISLSIYKAMEPTLRYSTAHLPLRKHEDFNSIRGISLPTGHDIIGMCSDGVGTKSSFALEYGDWSGIGFDLLAMVCDDAVAIGATPQAITTTIDVGEIKDEEIVVAISCSIARAAMAIGVPIIGGEFAQLGDMVTGAPILNATVTWTATARSLITGYNVKPGDQLLAFPEVGFRSNGYTLLRKALGIRKRHSHKEVSKEERELILQPSTIYCNKILVILQHFSVSGLVHITGGGLSGKLEKYLRKSGTRAKFRGAVTGNPLMLSLIEDNSVSYYTACNTWNMGVGFVIVSDNAVAIQKFLQEDYDIQTEIIGEVE